MTWISLAMNVLLLAGAAPQEDAKEKWAAEIAQDFFSAVFADNHHYYNVIGLLSTELADLERQNRGPIDELALYRSALITQKRIAPDGTEVVLVGTLEGRKRGTDAAFRMRIAKEPNGKWNIRYLAIQKVKGDVAK